MKVVLAAAMWSNPHMVVLDEPTNFLDRDSLGALAGAIKDYGGALVVISHNKEFLDTLCNEWWAVADRRVAAPGNAAYEKALKTAAKPVKKMMPKGEVAPKSGVKEGGGGSSVTNGATNGAAVATKPAAKK